MSTPSREGDLESFLCSERILADSPGCTGISRKATISFSSAETFHATPPVHRVSVPRVDFSFSFPFVLPPKARQEGRQTGTHGTLIRSATALVTVQARTQEEEDCG